MAGETGTAEGSHSLRAWRGRLRRARVGLLAIGLVAVLAGCHLGEPASASFASVRIPNRTVAEIQLATTQVFRENGYAGGVISGTDLRFEKEGSQANNIGQNGAVGSYYGQKTIIRVKASVVELGSGEPMRLQCQAFMVRNAGDSFFEDEHRLTNIRSRPYQKLLDEVAKRLL